jgi:sugar/nucleoside kinase (ribokinase family)
MNTSPGTAAPEVVCAGILVADLFVPPLPALPTPGQLLATDDFLIDTGGCAANVATCLARLGVPAAAVGMVGQDIFGEFVRQNLQSKGVETSGIACAAGSGTSKTVILPVVGQDRRFIHTFGANADFRVSDVDLSRFPKARVLYVGGYLVMPAIVPGELAGLLKEARRSGLRTALDVVVPAHDAGRSMGALATVLQEVDLFLPNEDEARELTGETDPARQTSRFLSSGCGAVVITRGGKGALYRSLALCLEADAYPVEFVDGSGSGDAFAAGCILGLLEGWDPPAMLRFASALGASACARLGCTTGVFTRAEADAFLREHRLRVREATQTS